MALRLHVLRASAPATLRPCPSFPFDAAVRRRRVTKARPPIHLNTMSSLIFALPSDSFKNQLPRPIKYKMWLIVCDERPAFAVGACRNGRKARPSSFFRACFGIFWRWTLGFLSPPCILSSTSFGRWGASSLAKDLSQQTKHDENLSSVW